MTVEEITNSWEFKTGKRLLLKKFPFIKDVVVDKDPNRYDSVVFVNLVIEPFEFAQHCGVEVATWAENAIKRGDYRGASGVCVFTSIECGDPRGREIEDLLTDEFNKGRLTKAVPSDKKSGIKKAFLISEYKFKPNVIPPTQP